MVLPESCREGAPNTMQPALQIHAETQRRHNMQLPAGLARLPKPIFDPTKAASLAIIVMATPAHAQRQFNRFPDNDKLLPAIDIGKAHRGFLTLTPHGGDGTLTTGSAGVIPECPYQLLIPPSKPHEPAWALARRGTWCH